MHRNYYLFEKQVEFLNKYLRTFQLNDCFTHRKDELAFRLTSHSEDCMLRIGLDNQYPYILLYESFENKDPKTHFFRELYGKPIKEIRIKPYDKIIYIDIDQYTLVCIFYGKLKNVLLRDSQHNLIETFKKYTEVNGRQYKFCEEMTTIKPDTDNPVKITPGMTVTSYMHEKYPAFNKLMVHELCFRCSCDSNAVLSTFSPQKRDQFSRNVDTMVNELNDKRLYLYEAAPTTSILSLLRLDHLPSDVPVSESNDINSVWKKFIYQNQYKNRLSNILAECRIKISKRIEYLEKTLHKMADTEELNNKKKLSELKGNLLLTFSSKIHKGVDHIKLRNIYSDDGEEVTINLDPRLNAQQNANNYFQKYKNIDEKKISLTSKKETLEDELKFWKKSYDHTEKIDNLKKAEKLRQSLIKDKLLQKDKSKYKDSASNIFSFNRLLLQNHWEVLIGKNAENNDILTFKFANKNDLWFHAQGVPGSHVILRSRERGQIPSMDIIKQVASIAAYHSAAQSSSTVAVNYTEVRYVRKPRKSKPGTALLMQSKTIFVQPKKYL